MIVKLTRIEIEHFKGVTHREIDFNQDMTDLRGRNGSGKSTIASAFFFVLSDCDYQLNNKPMVQPLGNTEVHPRVKLWLDIDSKVVTVEKTQKTTFKSDENSGKTSMTTSNTYAVNDVPKTLRDYTQYMTELGIDLDKLLILSHPDAFTKDNSAKGREKMRSALFEMVSDKSDLDIAKGMQGINELTAELNKEYKLDEIKAMNQATIKKIEADNGKHNELLDARIQGLIEGKIADIDVKTVQDELDTLNKKKTQILEAMNDGDASEPLADKLKELQLQVLKEIENANADLQGKRTKLTAQIGNCEQRALEAKKRLNKAKSEAEDLNDKIAKLNADTEALREKYKAESDRDVIVSEECPYCNQKLPESELEKLRKQMADKKANTLKEIIAKGAVLKDRLAAATEQLNSYLSLADEIETQLAEIEKEETDAEGKLAELPTQIEAKDIPEVVTLQGKISALKAEMDNTSNDDKERLNDEYNKVSEAIENNKAALKQAEQNSVIDEKISALRDKKMSDEIQKAKAEKLLFQISEFEKYKNDLLTNEINKHFSLVDWKLYDFAKNGEYKEVCVPTYEGKQIDVDTNTALSVAMKMDIATSLQKYNNLFLPIYIDKAESLDSQTRKDICEHTDTQVIWLTVDDCDLQIV